MTYIESHSDLISHPKVIRLKRIWGVSRPLVLGHLHMLWHWAAQYAQNGDLSKYTADDLADAADWEGDSEAFRRGLIDCGIGIDGKGFLETDEQGALRIHDWFQSGGKLIVSRGIDAFRKRYKRYPYDHEIRAQLSIPENVTLPPCIVRQYDEPTQLIMQEPVKAQSDLLSPPDQDALSDETTEDLTGINVSSGYPVDIQRRVEKSRVEKNSIEKGGVGENISAETQAFASERSSLRKHIAKNEKCEALMAAFRAERHPNCPPVLESELYALREILVRAVADNVTPEQVTIATRYAMTAYANASRVTLKSVLANLSNLVSSAQTPETRAAGVKNSYYVNEEFPCVMGKPETWTRDAATRAFDDERKRLLSVAPEADNAQTPPRPTAPDGYARNKEGQPVTLLSGRHYTLYPALGWLCSNGKYYPLDTTKEPIVVCDAFPEYHTYKSQKENPARRPLVASASYVTASPMYAKGSV
jgi:hypothetical protein